MTILEILWSWSSKPADDIFEILRIENDRSKEKSMNHNPKWLKIKMQPNIQTFTFVFCLKLPGFFWTCGFLDQKKPKLPALRLPVFIIRKLRPVDEGTELEHQMEVHHVLRGKILLYCSCAWIIPGIVSSLIDGEYLPPFQGVWNAGWNMIWNMQWSLLPLESFIWRCCKLIVCQVWFISQISGQKPENSIIRWSNYSTFGRVTCVFRCFSSSSSCKDFDVGILKGLERFGTQKSLALQVFFPTAVVSTDGNICGLAPSGLGF